MDSADGSGKRVEGDAPRDPKDDYTINMVAALRNIRTMSDPQESEAEISALFENGRLSSSSTVRDSQVSTDTTRTGRQREESLVRAMDIGVSMGKLFLNNPVIRTFLIMTLSALLIHILMLGGTVSPATVIHSLQSDYWDSSNISASFWHRFRGVSTSFLSDMNSSIAVDQASQNMCIKETVPPVTSNYEDQLEVLGEDDTLCKVSELQPFNSGRIAFTSSHDTEDDSNSDSACINRSDVDFALSKSQGLQGSVGLPNFSTPFHAAQNLGSPLNTVVEEHYNFTAFEGLEQKESFVTELVSAAAGKLELLLPNGTDAFRDSASSGQTIVVDIDSTRSSEEQPSSITSASQTQRIVSSINFASFAQGARPIHSLSTATYTSSWTKTGLQYLFDLLGVVYTIPLPPETSLQMNLEPGQCWAFAGRYGRLAVNLSTAVSVTHVGYDHIHPSLANDIKVIPRFFEVYGILDSQNPQTTLLDTSLASFDSKQNLLIANFEYNINSSENFQTFQVREEVRAMRIRFKYLLFNVTDNWGSEKMTCMYHLRVHGTLEGA